MSAKEVKKGQELDASLMDPPPLPDFLKVHERRRSRVDVDVRHFFLPLAINFDLAQTSLCIDTIC